MSARMWNVPEDVLAKIESHAAIVAPEGPLSAQRQLFDIYGKLAHFNVILRRVIDACKAAGTWDECRPTPPVGFVRYKPRTMPFNGDRSVRTSICPHCSKGIGECWSSSVSDGFQNAEASKTCKKAGYLAGALDDRVTCDGIAILCHPSRYSEGETKCGARLWHDWGGLEGPLHYYYHEPEPMQLHLFEEVA